MAFLWLPAAVRIPHGRTLSWAERTDPKGCLHTTETVGYPSYANWTVNPHLDVKPVRGKGVTVRQFLPFSQASFALRNLSGGVETNRDYVFQIELIGTCDKGGPSFKAGAYYWPDADEAVLLDLWRKVIKPMSDGLDIPVRAPAWQAYPASYGAASGSNNVRMSGSTFDNYSGWHGHQHVPENVHGDPGDFPWARMVALGRAAEAPPVTTTVEDDDMPSAQEIADAVWQGTYVPSWRPEDGYVPATKTAPAKLGRVRAKVALGAARTDAKDARDEVRELTAKVADQEELLARIAAQVGLATDQPGQ